MRILIVVQEKILADRLFRKFTKNKFACDLAFDAERGVDCALSGIYDAIFLEAELVMSDGRDVLKTLRQDNVSAPVIMLFPRNSAQERIRALNMGADGCLVNPILSEEALALLRAVLRRNKNYVPDDSIKLGDLIFDMSTYEIRCGERSAKLTAKEVQILYLLMSRGNRIVQKDELLLKVWGYDSDAEYNNLEVHIAYLRKKLQDIASSVSIKTVRGAGYCMEWQRRML